MSVCRRMRCTRCGSNNIRRRVNYPFGRKEKGIADSKCANCGCSDLKFIQDTFRRRRNS